MIELGVFAKTYERPSVEDVFGAVANDGIRHVQFNFSIAGLPTLPRSIPDGITDRIRGAADKDGICFAGISATFNLIHPDKRVVDAGINGLSVLARTASELGCDLLTLCTGTLDPSDMWNHHPHNATGEAWKSLHDAMQRAIQETEQFQVVLGVEPEPANVVSDAASARRFLDELQSDRVGIVFDPANLVDGVAPGAADSTIEEAFDLLGDDIVSVHAKDRGLDGSVVPAGKGVVAWDFVFDQLHALSYERPVLMHGLAERDVRESRLLLERALSSTQ